MQTVLPFIMSRFEQTGLITGFQANRCTSLMSADAAIAEKVVFFATVTGLQVFVMHRLPDVGKSAQ
jgi:hypothetical protein